MNGKLIAMILGVALVLATAAVYTQSASATATPHGNNGNGVTDGQTAHGLATACSHSTAADNNPNCGQTPTGGLASNINHNN